MFIDPVLLPMVPTPNPRGVTPRTPSYFSSEYCVPVMVIYELRTAPPHMDIEVGDIKATVVSASAEAEYGVGLKPVTATKLQSLSKVLNGKSQILLTIPGMTKYTLWKEAYVLW